METMPKYVYKCKECDFVKEVVHSMQEKLKDCEECGTIDVLTRVPSFTIASKSDFGKEATGDRVKGFIEEARAELKEERATLKRKEFSND